MDRTTNQNIEHSDDFNKRIYEYKQNLEHNGYPVIFSLKHFSLLIEEDYKKIKNTVDYSYYKSYRYFKLKKKKGGFRVISSPNDYLKFIQNSIKSNILDKVPLDKSCIAFRSGYSIIDNAKPHLSKELILKVDLLNFFDTISQKRVYGVFKSLGYCKNLAVDFAKLTTCLAVDSSNTQLPQGAPTSPILANIIATNLDRRLRALCERKNISYTRYADDLTFSGDKINMPSLKIIRHIIEDEGFLINEKKVIYRKKGMRQIVTGLDVSGEVVRIPKKLKSEVAHEIYCCKKYGVKKHLLYSDRTDKSNYYDWLLGKIMFIKSIHFEQGEEMLTNFNSILWEI